MAVPEPATLVPETEVPGRRIEDEDPVPVAAVTLPERELEPEAEAGREVPVLLRELEPDAEAGRDVPVLLPVARVDELVRTELEVPLRAELDAEFDAERPLLPQLPNCDWQPVPQ